MISKFQMVKGFLWVNILKNKYRKNMFGLLGL